LRRFGGVSEARSGERESPAEIPSEVEGALSWTAKLRRFGGVSEARSGKRESPAEIPSEVEGTLSWTAKR